MPSTRQDLVAPSKNPSVFIHRDGLDKRIEVLSQTVSDLESRLVSVLRQEPRGLVETDKAAQSLVPLAASLSGFSDRIDAVTGDIRSIIDRLEI